MRQMREMLGLAINTASDTYTRHSVHSDSFNAIVFGF